MFKGDYYLTGDRAMCDADGYFWFVGRGDDIITSAGYVQITLETTKPLQVWPGV